MSFILRFLAVFSLVWFCSYVPVRADVELFVSPTGSDSNPGTKDKPFATLERARKAVRKLKPENSHIKVWLQEGAYQLKETLVFSVGDSAPAGGTITYGAQPDATVILSSGAPLQNWKRLEKEPAHLPAAARGKVWVADAPHGIKRLYTLYDGLKRLRRARTEGFTSPEYHKPDQPMDTFYFPAGKIKNWPDLKEAELLTIPSCDYEMNILPIAFVDEAKGMAKVGRSPTRRIGRVKYFDQTMWVENILEALDQPGEWVFNHTERKIYLWPEGNEPSKGIVAPALTELVRVEGKIDYDGPRDQSVTGLVFQGLTFAHTDRFPWHGETGWGLQHNWEMFDRPTAAVRFRGAENCAVQASRFTASSGTGIRLDLTCRKNRIVDNEFSHLGASAILLSGYGPGHKDSNVENEVRNNWIHHTGEIYWATPAIMVWQSGRNRLANNLIHNTPYTGIAVSGRISLGLGPEYTRGDAGQTVRWHELGKLTRPYSWDEWYYYEKYLHARGNVVEKNEIHHVMETMGDGNGVYVSGCGRNNHIYRNYIHDCTGPHMGAAIRCDDFQNETIIEGNILHRNRSVQTGISMTGKNDIINNIIADITPSPRPMRPENIVHGYISVPALHPYGTNDAQLHLTGARIQRNIVYSLRPSYLPILEHRSFSTGPGTRLVGTKTGNNLYWCPPDSKWGQKYLDEQQALGVEKESLSVDPKFVDIANGDLRLAPDSPALKLGFEEVDISSIGLLPNHPFSPAKKTRAQGSDSRASNP